MSFSTRRLDFQPDCLKYPRVIHNPAGPLGHQFCLLHDDVLVVLESWYWFETRWATSTWSSIQLLKSTLNPGLYLGCLLYIHRWGRQYAIFHSLHSLMIAPPSLLWCAGRLCPAALWRSSHFLRY